MTRASVDFSGGDSNCHGDSEMGCWSRGAQLSADGRYVMFTSRANNLVPDDHNGRVPDVFVRDLQVGTNARVSVDTAGGDPNGTGSFGSSISADGRYVVYYSYASDLVPGDGNASPDVFVRDRHMGTTTRVSVDTGGGDANRYSFGGSISADGRYIVFYSSASDLVPEDGNGIVQDVFVRDLQTGITSLVSVDTSGGDANDESGDFGASISADGRHVAFESRASDLVAGDTNMVPDVFVRDLQAGSTTRASVTAGSDINSSSFSPSLSADGRYVAFHTGAADLVPGDNNGLNDVYVRDVQEGTTTRVSVNPAGADPDHHSSVPSMSADGRYIAFESQADNLVLGDTNGESDVFVRDLQTHTTRRVSVDLLGRQATGWSDFPSISADGRYVAFESDAANLVSADGNGWRDVFVRAVGTPTVDSVAPSTVARGTSSIMTVLGSGYLAGAQVSANAFGPGGVNVTSVTVISETKLEVAVSVDPAATIGARNLVVWNPGTGPGPLATSWGFCFDCLTVT